MSLGNDGFGRSIKGPSNLITEHVGTDRLFGQKLFSKLQDEAVRQFRISSSAEVLPNEASAVTLSPNVDELGVPKPHVTFTVENYTRDAFAVIGDIFGQLLGHLSSDTILHQAEEYTGAGHIMGTTRMGADPKTSVVDAHCRSHDQANLFIFSSSVFPTGGTANPTLTAVALTLRGLRLVRRDLKTGVTAP
jgi:glucose dehydrogenase